MRSARRLFACSCCKANAIRLFLVLLHGVRRSVFLRFLGELGMNNVNFPKWFVWFLVLFVTGDEGRSTLPLAL